MRIRYWSSDVCSSDLAAQHDVALVGGDTTRGPLSVCVTAHGFVEPGRALRRVGARVGDDVWVTGTPGDAAGALQQWRAGGNRDPVLRARLERPTPRIAAGLALAGLASSRVDVSAGQIGRASCRASACQDEKIVVVAVHVKTKTTT